MSLGSRQGSTGAAHVDAIIAGVRTAMREIKCIGSERVVRHGLSMSTWHVLVLLDRHGDVSMSRLAELLDVSLSNATGLIDRMEERGLVERVRVPDDRRVVIVRVSDAGRQLLTEVEVLGDEMIRRVLERLEPAQLARVARAMQDVQRALVDVVTNQPDGLWSEHVHGQVHSIAGVAAPKMAVPAAPASGGSTGVAASGASATG